MSTTTTETMMEEPQQHQDEDVELEGEEEGGEKNENTESKDDKTTNDDKEKDVGEKKDSSKKKKKHQRKSLFPRKIARHPHTWNKAYFDTHRDTHFGSLLPSSAFDGKIIETKKGKRRKPSREEIYAKKLDRVVFMTNLSVNRHRTYPRPGTLSNAVHSLVKVAYVHRCLLLGKKPEYDEEGNVVVPKEETFVFGEATRSQLRTLLVSFICDFLTQVSARVAVRNQQRASIKDVINVLDAYVMESKCIKLNDFMLAITESKALTKKANDDGKKAKYPKYKDANMEVSSTEVVPVFPLFVGDGFKFILAKSQIMSAGDQVQIAINRLATAFLYIIIRDTTVMCRENGKTKTITYDMIKLFMSGGMHINSLV